MAGGREGWCGFVCKVSMTGCVEALVWLGCGMGSKCGWGIVGE